MYHYNATWLPSKYLTFNVLCSAHFSLFHHLASAQSPSSCQSTNVQMTGCKSGAMSVLLWCYKGLKYRVFLLPDDMNKNIPGQTKYPSNYLVMDWSWFLSTFLHNSCIFKDKMGRLLDWADWCNRRWLEEEYIDPPSPSPAHSSSSSSSLDTRGQTWKRCLMIYSLSILDEKDIKAY